MNERPVRLTVTDDLVRGRVSVFFRLLLAIPLFVWLALWTIAVIPIAIANWVATLLLGRSPAALHNFLAKYVTYTTHVYAYANIAAEPYPIPVERSARCAARSAVAQRPDSTRDRR